MRARAPYWAQQQAREFTLDPPSSDPSHHAPVRPPLRTGWLKSLADPPRPGSSCFSAPLLAGRCGGAVPRRVPLVDESRACVAASRPGAGRPRGHLRRRSADECPGLGGAWAELSSHQHPLRGGPGGALADRARAARPVHGRPHPRRVPGITWTEESRHAGALPRKRPLKPREAERVVGGHGRSPGEATTFRLKRPGDQETSLDDRASPRAAGNALGPPGPSVGHSAHGWPELAPAARNRDATTRGSPHHPTNRSARPPWPTS
jgi:hypothetical protein